MKPCSDTVLFTLYMQLHSNKILNMHEHATWFHEAEYIEFLLTCLSSLEEAPAKESSVCELREE